MSTDLVATARCGFAPLRSRFNTSLLPLGTSASAVTRALMTPKAGSR